MVGDVGDVIEGERHGLQGRQLSESLNWHLRQSVVIQPEVTKRVQTEETARRNARDVIRIQPATKNTNTTQNELGNFFFCSRWVFMKVSE